MNISPFAVRLLFVSLCSLVFFLASMSLVVLLAGLIFALALISMESLIKRWHPRNFFLAVLGIFSGSALGEGLYTLLTPLSPFDPPLLHIALLIGSVYAATVLVSYAADEVAISLPFIRFKVAGAKKRDLLLDISVLSDPRVVDLALSGLIDGHLILPRFLVKELQMMPDDPKAKRCLETIRKLETMPHLEMKWVDTDFEDIKDFSSKLIKLARTLDANLLSADINKIQQAEIQGVKIINIHLLANALKPIHQTGEWLDVKVQRHGKEATQGVGYLDDGTMVVINGGAKFMDQTIRCQVLSVKHSGTGRLIFCNAPEHETVSEFMEMTSPANYFVPDYERHRV